PESWIAGTRRVSEERNTVAIGMVHPGFSRLESRQRSGTFSLCVAVAQTRRDFLRLPHKRSQLLVALDQQSARCGIPEIGSAALLRYRYDRYHQALVGAEEIRYKVIARRHVR